MPGEKQQKMKSDVTLGLFYKNRIHTFSDDSEITKEDDSLWPPPDRVGRQVIDVVWMTDCF